MNQTTSPRTSSVARLGALAALIGATLLAGCTTGAPTPAPQSTAGAPPTAATASPTPVAPTAAPPTATAAAATPPTVGETAEPLESTFHGAVDLEALIPDEVDGIPIETQSLTGQQYVDAFSGGNPEVLADLNDFLGGLGRSIDDVSAAFGSGFGETDHVNISATRAAGADPTALLDGAVQLAIASAPEFNSGMSATATEMTLGGKNVTLVTTVLGSMVYSEQYYYGYGDVLFVVNGGSEEIIASALSRLP